MKSNRNDNWTTMYAVCLLGAVVLGIVPSADAGVSIPNTFSAGTTISSSQVNANFTAVANQMPAVKQSLSGIWIAIPATAGQLSTISFTAPGNGFAMIFATGSIYLDTAASTASYACVDLDATTAVTGGCTPNVGSDTAVRIFLPAAFPDTTGFATPYSLIKVIAVTSGSTYSYYLNGVSTGATAAYLFQPNMTVLFVPNAMP